MALEFRQLGDVGGDAPGLVAVCVARCQIAHGLTRSPRRREQAAQVE
jgi:hypothetical protein